MPENAQKVYEKIELDQETPSLLRPSPETVPM